MAVHEVKLLILKLRRLLHSRGRSADDADDLIQEAFLRFELYCRERNVEQTEAFLVRTILNLSSDLRKRQHYAERLAQTLATVALGDSSPAADEVCANRERLQHLKAGLDRLSPRRREVFVLNRIEGYSFVQIAGQLGITLSAVEKHAAKALLLMTDWMESQSSQGRGAGR